MTIVCGTDFSSPSVDAVLVASLIGARLSEQVELAHVIDDVGVAIDDAGLAAHPARARLHRDAERGRLPGARIREQLVPGDLPQTLAALARGCGSELVVVALHGRVQPTRFSSGSAAERTVLRSSDPVLIVRGSAAFRSRRPVLILRGPAR